MNYKIVEKQVPSSDGVHSLYGKLYVPNGEIKGYFHVVHGMTEHIGRYDGLLSELASHGYLAFAFDNLGHGRTVNETNELGFISNNNGWKYLIEDIKVFYNAVKLEYGDMPYYLFGHSMGSFIVRVAVCRTVFPNAVILSGTGGKNRLAGLGIMLASIIKALKGKKHVSKFMDKIIFGSYNEKFKTENSKRSWITSDASLREKYDLDPLYNYRLSISALKDVITLNKLANSKKEYNKYSPKDKVLLICGNEDPVSKCGKGVVEVYEKLTKQKVNAKVKIYDGRHEVFNEPKIKEQVLTDVLEFIEK